MKTLYTVQGYKVKGFIFPTMQKALEAAQGNQNIIEECTTVLTYPSKDYKVISTQTK